MYGWHQGKARLTAEMLRQGLPTWLSNTITSPFTSPPDEEVAESEQSDGSDDSAPEEATLNPIAKLKRTYKQVRAGGVANRV